MKEEKSKKDYLFTKVHFSKYETNFLSDCSPFTGNVDYYDISGNYVYREENVSSTGMMFSEKKPLWKRILRKLV